MDKNLESKYAEALKKSSNKIKELLTEISTLKKKESIAVIGIGCRFPGGANSPEEFWEILEKGIDTIKEIPPNRWNSEQYYDPDMNAPGKMNTKYGGFLDEINKFDSLFFGISPKEVESLDPQQRFLLEVSWEALENAGQNVKALKESQTGVFIGMSGSDYLRAHLIPEDICKIGTYAMTGTAHSVASGRISYLFGFQGPNMAVDTACSSSLVALHLAVNSLQNKESNLALAGGVNIFHAPEIYIGLAKLNSLSADGRCRAFDAQANGFGRGEGCGIVVLKRLSEAIRDGDHILAVIKGSAVNQDGHTNGLTAPNGGSQQKVIRQALDNSQISPEEVGYIETHGTGTPLGDPIEVGSLSNIFKNEKLFIGSVKSNIAHLEGAAGIASVIKVILSLQHGKIPPSLHFENPNPHIPWDELQIEVPTENTPWPKSPRVAGVSAFGFGGTNAHVIIEEPPSESQEKQFENKIIPLDRPLHLLTLSAKKIDALQELAVKYEKYFEPIKTNEEVGNICYTTNVGRSHFNHRLSLLGDSITEIKEKLSDVTAGNTSKGVFQSRDSEKLNSDVVFLFTGQGSQYQGMGRELYNTQPIFKKKLDQCSELLSPYLNTSLVNLLYSEDDPDQLLEQPLYAHSAIFSIGYALAKLWESWGITPSAVVGHSIGEYVASCIAGLFDLESAVKLIATRSKLIQSLPDGGIMGAVFVAEEHVLNAIEGLEEKISIASINAPENVAISGEKEAVDEVLKRLEKKEMASHLWILSKSHAFHSPLMKPILNDFKAIAAEVEYSKPRIPIISTLTGKPVKVPTANSSEGWSEYWTRHIHQTVRYCDAIKFLEQENYEIFLEIGATPILTGLGQQSFSEQKGLWLHSLRPEQSDWEQMLNALAPLYTHGLEINWAGFDQPYSRKKVALPTYPFQREQYQTTSSQRFRQGTEEKKESSPISLPNVGIEEHQIPKKQIQQKQRATAIPEVKEILHQLSGISVSEIEEEANLFSLGVDSLMLVQAKQKIETNLTVDIPLRHIFQETPTVKKIADFVDKELAERAPIPALNETEKEMREGGSISTESQLEGEGYTLLEKMITQQNQIMKQQLDFMALQLETLKDPSSLSVQKDNQHQNRPAFSQSVQYDNFRGVKFTKDENLSVEQEQFIKNLIISYTQQTSNSKEYAANHRAGLSDWVNSLGFRLTLKEIMYPIVAARSSGSRFWDIDDNEYIDIAIGYGVSYFGHRPSFVVEAIEAQMKEGFELAPQSDLAGEVADLVREMTGVERVTFCNTGSEAVMIALRIARTVTQKKKIALFAGAYHGIFDGVLAFNDEKGSVPIAPGIPPEMVEDILILNYDTPKAFEKIREHQDELAAILVEPVQSRQPHIQPKAFLRELRQLTSEIGVALIFDEMVTGFRIHPGGAQAYFDVKADIVTYGKVIGGGMPIGMVAGASRFMDAIDGGIWNYGDDSYPNKDTTFFGGTFCKHPLTMAAARAILLHMKQQGPSLQETVNQRTTYFASTVNAFLDECHVPIKVTHFGSQFRIDGSGQYNSLFKPLEMDLFFYLLMKKGVYTWEKRISFFSTAHTDEDVEFVIQAVKESILELQEVGFFPESHPLHPDKPLQRESTPLEKKTEVITESLPDLRKNAEGLDYPISSGQKRLYVLSEFAGGELNYHIPGAWLIEGEIDFQRLEQCFNQLIQRHESLRTCFMMEEDELVCRLQERIEFEILLKSGKEEDLKQMMYDFIQPFDFSKAPLFRVCCIHLSSTRYLLVLDTHHIIFDGLSLNLFMKEFMALYKGQTLSPLKAQYRDYVIWQNEFFESKAFEQQEAYWLNQFCGELPLLELPTDYPRPKQPSFEGGEVLLQFPVTELNKLARSLGTSLYMVLVTVYYVWLARLTNQEDIVVGTTNSLRPQEDFNQMIGMTTNTLAMRCYPKEEKRFSSFLNEVKNRCLEVYAHMDYPFERLVEKLGQARNPNRHPVFDTMFAYEKADDRILELEDVQIFPYSIEKQSSMVDLGLDVVEQAGILNLSFEYDSSLFKNETIQRFAGYFINILREVIKNPELPLFDIEILPPNEKKQILEEFNNTTVPYPESKTLVDIFEEQVERTPDNCAIISDQIRLTYRELNERANQLAHFLREEYQIQPDDRVTVLLDRSEWLIIATLGILKAGGAYVPIDPQYPPQRIEFMIQDSQCRVLLTDPKKRENITIPQHVEVLEISQIPAKPISNLVHKIRPSHLAYVIYTSGSTGNPKGVMVHHQPVVNLISDLHKRFRTSNKNLGGEQEPLNELLIAPYIFDTSVQQIFGCLLYGNCLHVISEELKQEVFLLNQYIVEHEIIKILEIPPSLFAMMLDAGFARLSNLKLEHLLVGGEAVPQSLLGRFYQENSYSSLTISNMYGPTECCVNSIAYQTNRKDAQKLTSFPIGKPMGNYQVYLLDQRLSLVPIGVVGEICISGVGLARGYLNRPDLTEESFVPHPFKKKERLYRTGDLGYWLPDGNIEFLGRKDDQVQVRGYRVELGEIEHRLLEHPNVREAVVLARELGEPIKELIAYLRASEPLNTTDLRHHLSSTLPDYMIPSYFVQVEKMPLNPSGKVNKKALPDPEGLQLKPETHYESPRDSVETQLVNLWQEVLNQSPIGIHDNFFERGGHSLKAIQILSKIHQLFEVELGLSEIFATPTIASLAKVVRNKESKEFSLIPSLPTAEHYALSRAQRRLWVLAQLNENAVSYNMAGALLLVGILDRNAFSQAFETVVARHESMRTTFLSIEGEPRQKIHEKIDFKIEEMDLSEEKDPDQSAKAQITQESFTPFDLTQGPLFRMKLLYLTKQEAGIRSRSVLVFNIHHIISDGWSIDIMLKELFVIYEAFRQDKKSPLAPLRMHYKDYAAWQNALLATDTYEGHKQYWLKKLSGELPVLHFPTDYPRPSLQSFNAGSAGFLIDPELTASLSQFSQQQHVTLYMILLSAVNGLLFLYTSQEDMIVGVPMVERSHLDLEEQIGFYLNILPIRNSLDSEDLLTTVLEKVRQTILEGYQHQNYPFDLLVEDLQLKTERSRHPLFDVIVNHQETNVDLPSMDQLEVSMYIASVPEIKVDLFFDFEVGEKINGVIEYNSDLFKSETIKNIIDDLCRILQLFVENPEIPLKKIKSLLQTEEEQKEHANFMETITTELSDVF